MNFEKQYKCAFYTLIIFCFFFFTSTAQTTSTCKKETKDLWRELADSGKYQDAIDVLLDSLQTSKQKNKHEIYWHVGQLYAFNNEYDSAIENMKKSTNFFNKIFDREWRLYFNGTIAFLKKDKKKLKSYSEKLWKKHSGYYYFNAFKLKALYENFNMPYKLAYDEACK
jgi:tetratricopeptide (TPR) repeat protein